MCKPFEKHERCTCFLPVVMYQELNDRLSEKQAVDSLKIGYLFRHQSFFNANTIHLNLSQV